MSPHLLLLVLPVLAIAAPALAQVAAHAGHDMSDMAMPSQNDPQPDSAEEKQPADSIGTDQSPGSAEAPPISHGRAADLFYDPAAMAKAEAVTMRAPVTRYAQFVFDLAELQMREGRDGYNWEAEGWIGDVNRFIIKTEGEGIFGEDVEQAEVQAFYAHALDPWWTARIGLRQDFGPGLTSQRTWAALGIDGRAPYQFDVEGTAFLSVKGQLSARFEGAYDQRITQRLVLQPRAEMNLAAQDIPGERIGAGLSNIELGLRLRYEIRRQFAPYVGFNWSRDLGQTADYARADGESPSQRGVVAGARVWF